MSKFLNLTIFEPHLEIPNTSPSNLKNSFCIGTGSLYRTVRVVFFVATFVFFLSQGIGFPIPVSDGPTLKSEYFACESDSFHP